MHWEKRKDNKDMKKRILLTMPVIAGVLSAAMLTGCGEDKKEETLSTVTNGVTTESATSADTSSSAETSDSSTAGNLTLSSTANHLAQCCQPKHSRQIRVISSGHFPCLIREI